MRNDNLKMLVASAVATAMIAVLAQFTIPFLLVPNTLQPIAIGLVGTILGKKYGAVSAGLYGLMGAIGIPVFAGMTGGIGIILGPTGGYIIAFPIAAFFIGLYMEKIGDNVVHASIANIMGTAIILILGTIRLRFAADIPWEAAIASGITPFIITNPIQAIGAAIAGVRIRKAMQAARILQRTAA